ncbi:MAG: LexA family transcriptional regulator [Clostridia bacterium]|nr:LexA family transcriptional regulator [Clostridia bacterium]
MSKSAFTELKSGRTKSLGAKSLSKIAEYFGVSTDYLLSHGLVERVDAKKSVNIPVIGIVHAGVPIEAVQDILDFEEITPELAASGEFMALRVSGDSMEPRICAGDVVIVRRQPTAENGDVCVVMVNGDEATLKKIQRTDDGIMLIPFNSNYAPMFFTNKQIEQLPVTILGKVIENRQKY